MRDAEPAPSTSEGQGPLGADGSASMQKFIEQSISCILNPLGEHVHLLQRTSEQLGRDGSALAAKVEEICARLDRHDQLLLETEVSLAQKVDVVRLRHEVLQMGYEKRIGALEGAQRATEEKHQLVDQRLEGTDGAMQALRAGMDEAEANTHRLQLKVWHLTNLVQRLESSIAEAKDDSSNLGQRQHGLVRTVQKMKEDFEGKLQSLGKFVSGLEAKDSEAHKQVAAVDQRTLRLEEHCQQYAGWQATLEKETLARVFKELDTIRNDLGTVDEHCSRIMDSGRGATDVMRRLVALEEALNKAQKSHDADIRQSQHNMETLAAELRLTAQETSDCLAGARGLEAARITSDERIQQLERNSVEMQSKQDRLIKRTDNVEVNLNGVHVAQKDMERRVDEHSVEVDQVRAQQHRANGKLSEMEVGVQALKAELGATTEGVAKIAAHLDLAHDYLHGLSKGFQESGRKATAAQDGMNNPKSANTGRAPLPTLSTPRPRPLSATIGGHGRRPVSANRPSLVDPERTGVGTSPP